MNHQNPPKWKIALSSTLIFVWIDARGARKPQSVPYDTGRGRPREVVRKCNFLVSDAPLSPPPPPPSLIPVRVAALVFLAPLCLYLNDEVYSPVSIGRIDETDEVKEERWKVISASFHPLLSPSLSEPLLFTISAPRVCIYVPICRPPLVPPPGIRSRSNARMYVRNTCPGRRERGTPFTPERTSFFDSISRPRAYEATRTLTTPVSRIKDAGY